MISVAVTTYNRFDLTVKCVDGVLKEERVKDVVILDDCSTDLSFERLALYYSGNDIVRVIRQASNRGMHINKRDAIAYCKYNWVAILDSDNTFDSDYFNPLFDEPCYLSNVIYAPEKSLPNFIFTGFLNEIIDKDSIKSLLNYDRIDQLMNDCNYFIHKPTYLKVFEENQACAQVDTLWFFYLWMKAGNRMKVVPGMQYGHLVHPDSGWLQNASYNLKKGEEIKQLIREL